jgi:hypothetical protein
MAKQRIFRSMLDGRPVQVGYGGGAAAPEPAPIDDAPTEPMAPLDVPLLGASDETLEMPAYEDAPTVQAEPVTRTLHHFAGDARRCGGR